MSRPIFVFCQAYVNLWKEMALSQLCLVPSSKPAPSIRLFSFILNITLLILKVPDDGV
jgi:hypothetical protein